MRDPFEVLGVPRGATPAEVRAAYRRLCLRYHPDKHGSADPILRELAEERFKEVQAAYDLLSEGGAAPLTASVGRTSSPTSPADPPPSPDADDPREPERVEHDGALLGQILVAMGLVSEAKVRVALRQQERGDARRIGEILVTAHVCCERDIIRALAQQRGMPVVDLDLFHVPVRLGEVVPYRVALELRVVPVREDGGTLVLATSDPDRLPPVAVLASRFARSVSLALADPRHLARALNSATYGFGPPGGWEKRTFWNRFWQFAAENPLGPVDWIWSKISRRLPGISGPAFIVVVLGIVFGIIIASADELGPLRWIGLVPFVAALIIAGVYKLVRDAIVRWIHK